LATAILKRLQRQGRIIAVPGLLSQPHEIGDQVEMANATETATMPQDLEKETATSDSPPPSGLKGKINEKLQKHSHDADAAMKAFEGVDGQVIELTEEKSKALLRKIDRHLMPVC
jgi:ACS family allantoate permease-like MFS transporter